MDIKFFSDAWRENPAVLEELINQAKNNKGTIFAETTEGLKNLDSETYAQAILKMGYDVLLADFNGENGYCAYQVKGENVNMFYFYLPEAARNRSNVVDFSKEIIAKIKERDIGKRMIVGASGHIAGKVICKYLSRQMEGVDIENQTIDLTHRLK